MIRFLVPLPQLVVAMVVKGVAAHKLLLLAVLVAVAVLVQQVLAQVRLVLVDRVMLVAHRPARLQTTHQAAAAVQAQ